MRITSNLLRVPTRVKWAPVIRGAIFMDEDWMPGPYPKTKAEKLAAAKKYNLLPEEYEPYDPVKWEFSWGDYPHLPNLCYHDKNPYNAWDHLMHRRNWNDVLHVNEVLYDALRPALHPYEELPVRKLFEFFFWSFIIILGINELFWKFERITVFKPRHMPLVGEVHYHYPGSNLKVYE